MKKKTDSTISLPVWAQLLLPVLVTVLCAGIVLLCSIRPYEQAKTYLKVAFMAGSTSAAGEGTNGLNIVQTDIDTDYTGKTDSEGTPAAVAYGSQCAVLEAKSIGLYVPVYYGGGSELLEQGACLTTASALLGASGNSVISGHVNTFFHDLSQLQVGDTVTAYTTYGKFTYEVTEQIQFALSLDLARLGDGPAVEQELLRQCGLARIGMGDDGKGPSALDFRFILRHELHS